MNMRQAVVAALRRDPDLLPKVAGRLRDRIDEEGAMARVVQAAEAIEPIIAGAVRKRPSRLNKLGLKSAHLLAGLAAEDASSGRRLTKMARDGIVGIVFIDVEGFTEFTAANGDRTAIEFLSRLGKIVQRVASNCKGEVVKHLGDGFLLAFPSASQAVRASVALQRAVSRDAKIPLQLRVAVHAGEPLVEQDDLLGHDVNLTARLLDHCEPGTVIVSQTAKELAERRLRTVSFGKERSIKIKGLAGKVTVYRVEPAKQEAA
jgi:class 3 adenylate cyclase